MISEYKNTLKVILLLIAAIVISIDLANSTEQIYYSIHFATLRNLKDINEKINSLKVKEQIIFWEKTEHSGIGKLYRFYVGKYNKWEDAVSARDKLKKGGFKGHLGIQWFDEKVPIQEQRAFSKAVKPDSPEAIHRLPKTSSQDRFVDNRDGTITDKKTNLMWIKNGRSGGFISAMTWSNAIEKCKCFRLGNYTNWRLPTVDEWIGLIDSNRQNPAIIEPNPFENMVTHMPYWTQSTSSYSQVYIYTVVLFLGNIQKQNKNAMAFVMPVRSIDTQ